MGDKEHNEAIERIRADRRARGLGPYIESEEVYRLFDAFAQANEERKRREQAEKSDPDESA